MLLDFLILRILEKFRFKQLCSGPDEGNLVQSSKDFCVCNDASVFGLNAQLFFM